MKRLSTAPINGVEGELTTVKLALNRPISETNEVPCVRYGDWCIRRNLSSSERIPSAAVIHYRTGLAADWGMTFVTARSLVAALMQAPSFLKPSERSRAFKKTKRIYQEWKKAQR